MFSAKVDAALFLEHDETGVFGTPLGRHLTLTGQDAHGQRLQATSYDDELH